MIPLARSYIDTSTTQISSLSEIGLNQSIQVVNYSEEDSDQWESFVERATMGTFLHKRRFLAYHGDRFRDVSLLFKDTKGHVVGLFPAAVDPEDSLRVISHPGITFGGILHTGELKGEKMIEALNAVRVTYAKAGFTTLSYRAVPYPYHQIPSGDDLYALFRLGAVRIRCDLSCAIAIANRGPRSSRRKRSLDKATRYGVEVGNGEQFVDELWKVVEDNLINKLGQRPVHSVEEIKYLHSLFPENIRFVVGLLDGIVVAGVTLFSTRQVTRAQYIASTALGYESCGVDAVIESCIQKAQLEQVKYFDFGTSNRNAGKELSNSLYQFKAEFGAGGVAHEFYDLELKH